MDYVRFGWLRKRMLKGEGEAVDELDIQRLMCLAAEFTQQSLVPVCRQANNAMKCTGILLANPTASPVIKAGFRKLTGLTKSMLGALGVMDLLLKAYLTAAGS
ncbi:unnamed protein product [Gongylonema pulchrum]|uniref:LETM1 domain-containing protein n=1 Tax=Gongylonema pulchrum TaxID=637853 RepID=A0A183EPN8_9BILA|nr:unnamed protein product [Gongylonema pulchrum]